MGKAAITGGGTSLSGKTRRATSPHAEVLFLLCKERGLYVLYELFETSDLVAYPLGSSAAFLCSPLQKIESVRHRHEDNPLARPLTRENVCHHFGLGYSRVSRAPPYADDQVTNKKNRNESSPSLGGSYLLTHRVGTRVHGEADAVNIEPKHR